jgi:uncharacterized membrane protein YgcG
MRRLLLALLAAIALLFGGRAEAAERILRLHSDIAVQPNGDLHVRETIRVRAEGNQIQRGIFRDFPTEYSGRDGRRVRVGFQVDNVRRDERDEPHQVEDLDDGKRVRIGSADVFLKPGVHEYVIDYRTTRQLGFFESYDELYWNVTGNGWSFPIEVAEARISLPQPVQFGQRAIYTGPQGGTGKNAELISEHPGEIVFRTTQPLPPNEGLTVAIAWPKGVVEAPVPPTSEQLWLEKNGPPIAGGLGLLAVLAYYFHAWRLAGRGPPAGPVVPTFSPPDGMSAAAIRYVSEMGFDNRTFAAAIVESGVKGRLRLVENEGGLFSSRKTTIEKVEGGGDLPAPEQAMLAALFSARDRVLMDDDNHKIFSAGQKALREGLEKAHKGKLFVENLLWSFAGIIVLVIVMALVGGMLILTDAYAPQGALAAPTVALGSFLICLLILLFRRGWGSTERIVAAILATIFAVIGSFASIATIGLALDGGRVLPMLVPLLALPVALSAFWWMAAPTRAGGPVMDRIAGFRQYLSITEEERLETMHPPEKTPELFERYLPHAIALKVENSWAARFQSVLAAAAASGQATGMGWYSGNRDPWADTDGFADRVGSSLSSSISSASTAPGSTSGSGGGGSSGGGGGGGGGGGW